MTGFGFRILMLACVVSAFFITNLSAQDRVVKGYYMYWSKASLPPSQVPWEDLTHLANAFIWPDQNANLIIHQAEHPELVQRAIDEGVIPIISVGGWGQSDAFSGIAASPELRAKFNQNLVDYILARGYGGIDLDWEYPAAADKQNLTLLVRELRELLDEQPEHYELSMAMPSVDWRNGYDVGALNNYVDWFGLMTYDFHGSWTDRAGHNSPLYASANSQCNTGSIHQSVLHYRQKGLPQDKIVVGLASYGRQFNSGVLCGLITGTANNGAAVPYHEAMNRINSGWTREWDPISNAVYLRNPDQTRIITFDDTTTFRLKAEYIVENNLKGAMVWALGYDKVGTEHPLMEVLGGLHREVVSTPDHGDEIPSEFKVDQNYPNPFNPSTTIVYHLSEQREVNITIHDVTGRQVSELDQRVRQPGTHSVVFDASALPSGVYFYTLTANGISLTRKMTLLK